MTALSESFYLTSIHNVFSWLISTFLLFSQIRKPILDRGPQTPEPPLTFLTQHWHLIKQGWSGCTTWTCNWQDILRVFKERTVDPCDLPCPWPTHCPLDLLSFGPNLLLLSHSIHLGHDKSD